VKEAILCSGVWMGTGCLEPSGGFAPDNDSLAERSRFVSGAARCAAVSVECKT
jgi:hypothetical protein